MTGSAARVREEPLACDGDRSSASDALAQDRAIAASLRLTWDTFFARFGRLTSVQRAAVPRILAGEHVLVCSATASGKTEAACAPLVERLLRRPSRRRSRMILYVSPTRALVNDLHVRLSSPLARVGLRVERRTGDHRTSLASPPDVLLTTPESFDSMLCRGRTTEGHALGGVEAVVLDEVHLLHGSARGEQVRWLLARLERLRSQGATEGWASDRPLQRVALSATVPDADAVRGAYMPDGYLVRVPGAREIDVVEPEDSTRPESAVPTYVGSIAPRREKILVFVDSRRRADELAYTLRGSLSGTGYVVHAHHGSLARPMREEAEQAVRDRDRIVLVATSTLEIGVDIGDVDLVVLDGPPPDVSALLQRIGRGNRRTGTTRVMPCARTGAERMVLDAMLDAAAEGWLGPGKAGPQHAVARQQVASYVFQSPSRARSRRLLTELLEQCGASAHGGLLLAHLEANGELLADSAGSVRLGDDWLERASTGEIHSTIEQPPGQTLLDERTGRPLVHGVDYRGGRGIAAGGEFMEVRGTTRRGVLVRRGAAEVTPDAEWSYRSRGGADPSGQAAALRRFLGLADHVWPVLRHRGWRIAFHLGGSRVRAMLDLLGGAADSDVVVTPWVLAVQGGGAVDAAPRWLREATAARLRGALRSRLTETERALGRPRANAALPEPLRSEELEGWLRVEEMIPRLVTSVWSEAAPGDSADRLRRLLAIAALPARVVGEGGIE